MPSIGTHCPPWSLSLTAHDIVMLKRMLAGSGSSSMGTGGSVTDVSRTERRSSTKSGTSFAGFVMGIMLRKTKFSSA
jgi:hypothetical protein